LSPRRCSGRGATKRRLIAFGVCSCVCGHDSPAERVELHKTETAFGTEVAVDIEQSLELFELRKNFTAEELDQSYKDLVQVWHPDRYANNPRLQQKADEKLKEINSAYGLLKELLSKLELSLEKTARYQESSECSDGNTLHERNEPQESAIGAKQDHTYVDEFASHRITLTSMLHPTDFSEASEVAFGHALKLAVMAKAKLSILHVTPRKDDVGFSDFPEVRQTLERWGMLPAGSSKEDVLKKAGILVEKVVAVHDDPAFSTRQFLERHPRDLMVLATHQYREPVRWLRRSVAAPVARESDGVTLFIPQGIDGFVSYHDGTVRLERILIPIDFHPRPQPAIDAATTLARILGCTDCLFTLVHVGDPHDVPAVVTPTQVGLRWEKVTRQGDVVKEILELERQRAADLIVMTTQGRDGFLDALRGSTTERVLRGSRCPLLVISASQRDLIIGL
jgi:nucleotide-binding universal stress UspA family protein